MMDTVLNLGLNDESVRGLAKQTGGDMRFANDAYRRFIQMFGKIVMDVPADAFEHALDAAKERKGPGTQDTDLDADDLAGVIERFRAIYQEHTGDGVPAGSRATSCGWRSTRSSRRGTASAPIDYRRQNKISDDLGTAVNVQAMVFGNLGDDSGTGVAFTRDPATGEKVPYGDYLANAQGEDVVAGIRNTLRIAELEQLDPRAYAELRTVDGHARGPLPRHVRHRVHDREAEVLVAADADRQADGVRRMGHGVRHVGGRADRRRTKRSSGSTRTVWRNCSSDGSTTRPVPRRGSNRSRRVSTRRRARRPARSCSAPTRPRSGPPAAST